MKNDPAAIDDMEVNRRHFDTVIIGLGKTGMSCVRYLAGCGYSSIALVDSRDDPPELDTLYGEHPDVPVYLGSYHEEILCAAGRLVVSPGVSLNEDALVHARDDGIEILNDIEIFCRNAAAPIIAVTGSNGKSTVATLVNEMINNSGRRALLGGNIGIPALDLLAQDKPDYYVLELSSFQLEPLNSLNAYAAVVLNISEDHMDRYRDINEYAAVKEKIYTGNGLMVINKDDSLVAGFGRTGREVCFYTLASPDEGVFGVRSVSAERQLAFGDRELLPVSQLQLHGDHNISDCLAALALGEAAGLPMESMSETLKNFRGLPHRCQWVADINGVDWYNDSKGTNVGASCAAIKGLSNAGPVVLIAGGLGKGADFSPLAEVGKNLLYAAVLIGADAAALGAVLEANIPVYYATSMEAAVRTAGRIARRGDVVLLSPACASFDMFTDYQDRGTAYMKAVSRLKEDSC